MEELIDKIVKLKDLPKDLYKMDLWVDGKMFNSIDTETGIVCFSEMIRLNCGCCSDYEPNETNFKSLYDQEQYEILQELVDKYIDND